MAAPTARSPLLAEVQLPLQPVDRQIGSAPDPRAAVGPRQASAGVDNSAALVPHGESADVAPASVAGVEAQEQLGYFDADLHPRRQMEAECERDGSVAEPQRRARSVLEAADEQAVAAVEPLLRAGPASESQRVFELGQHE